MKKKIEKIEKIENIERDYLIKADSSFLKKDEVYYGTIWIDIIKPEIKDLLIEKITKAGSIKFMKSFDNRQKKLTKNINIKNLKNVTNIRFNSKSIYNDLMGKE